MKKFINIAVAFGFSVFVGANAWAVTPVDALELNPNLGRFTSHLEGVFKSMGLDLRYQLGDEWGKRPVTREDLLPRSYFQRMAKATAHMRGAATAFYIGKYNGRHVMATNHHVCEDEAVCSGSGAVNFVNLGIRATKSEFYGSWSDVDLSLFAVHLTAEQAAVLEPLASPFAFNNKMYRGQPLMTIGFGIADNPSRVQVAGGDSDCSVFSEAGEARFIADPDRLNPADYKTWSFSNGCDISHGDSGSAMMDRETGEVVGIIWTGNIPKDKKVQSSEYLNALLANPNEDVWTELSYAVPAFKIGDYLMELVQSGNGLTPVGRETLRAIVGSN